MRRADLPLQRAELRLLAEDVRLHLIDGRYDFAVIDQIQVAFGKMARSFPSRQAAAIAR